MRAVTGRDEGVKGTEYPGSVRTPRFFFAAASLMLVALSLGVTSGSATAASKVALSGPKVSAITLKAPAYKPAAPAGATDDYHCSVLNPHVTKNSYIIGSQFFPGSAEDHHAILFLVPPGLAKAAEAANVHNAGWTCFGETPIPNTGLDQISNTPWLSAWAPGKGSDSLPKGTGVYLPAGSLVVMQVHFNLLVGDKPVSNKLVLHTVPATTPLLPLHLDLMPAPPDIPCPAGVTGPLCDRAASLANLGQRFGQDQVAFVNILEDTCGRSSSNPPAGDSTSCSWPVGHDGYIVRVGAHMHLLGSTFKMVLNPGTPQAKTILNVPAYNFHYQRAYDLKTPVHVSAGDTVGITCTYTPTLAQQLPILRKVAPHFITWGDGSSDEMCLGLMWTSDTLPSSHAAA
jgi:hypothetical protein